MAGRNAVIVSISPRDPYRYGFELHLDRETALPLKSLLLNDQGQLLERFQFTRLDTSATPSEQSLQPGSDCSPVTMSAAKSPDMSATQKWHLDWLPPGFQQISSATRKDSQTKSTVDSLMYDDGLARFRCFLSQPTALM